MKSSKIVNCSFNVSLVSLVSLFSPVGQKGVVV